VVAAAWLTGARPLGQDFPKPRPRPILILGGMLVDGAGQPPRRSDAIVIQDGRIKAMGLEAARRAPKDARTIDASGLWILPGLVDAAVHLSRSGGLEASPDLVADPEAARFGTVQADLRRAPAAYLLAYLCSGVTSVVDLGGPRWIVDLRAGRADDPLAPLITATGPALAGSVPPSLAASAGDSFLLMKDEADVAAQVAGLAALGSDLVAVRIESRSESGRTTPGLVGAAVSAAHARKLRVAAEVTTVEGARVALDAGADILVGSLSGEVDDVLATAMSSRHVVYVPALASVEALGMVASRQAAFEPFESACAPPAVLESFSRLAGLPATAFGLPAPSREALAAAARNVKRLADGGVTIATGTGAGDVRVLPGSSLHRELALLVGAGMTPMQALVAATRDAARVTGREAGQVKVGVPADLVLLDADPLADIRNTRRVAQVIRGGAIYDR